MPTVILLDVSLSMTRRIACEGKETQLRELAREGVYDFFDQLAKKCRLEFTALVAFSSLWEIVHEFTRDFEALKKCCSSVNIYDKTCITTALSGVERLVMDEWGPAVPVNLILVTDGRVGTGSGSLKEILRTINTRTTDTAFPLPFPFPCFLTIACLSVPSDFTEHKPWYEKLLKLNKGRGEIILPETPLCVKSVQNAFRSIFQSHYNQYEGSLLCGNLKSQITMFPSPNFKNGWLDVLGMYRKRKEEMHQLHMPSELKIIGFLDIADVASPAYVSRHLVLPVSKLSDDNKEGINDKEETSGTFGITEEDGKTPSFCVLLHGSLKIEKMVAVVQLRNDWYGMLYSWSDNKKKSSLMLSVFEPGTPFPWLGNLNNLGPAAEMVKNPYQYDQKEEAEETPFPVAPNKRRSYHVQPNTVWIRTVGLQADIQKLLRYAKKLPEKQSAFYKELNRLRRAALCYSFHGLLFYLADAFDKEARNASAEASRQLSHAAEGLRFAPQRDLSRNIAAMEKSILVSKT